ncbi:hypothetical protein V5T82_15300 [Magnetovibrio sp. PR-2]|uniref:hypothetical protein n=1 Tax=Magnetovibrio sp. PR-2 TaxID=3120356 RepID=UPI002FCDE321
MVYRSTKILPVLFLAGTLTACQATTGNFLNSTALSTADQAAQPKFVEMIKDIESDRLNDPWIRAGLEALDAKELQAASKAFNKALKFEPANPHLHFLNGLTYHLMAAQGDASQLDMAKVGYDLALRYDPSNFWAAYQQGQISFSEQRYREAQDAFAYALQYDDDNVDILRALATASYYAQDLDTALGAIEQASALRPNDESISYDAALYYAAAGEADKAEFQYAAFNAMAGNVNGFRKSHLKNRMNDWKKFHEENDAILHRVQSTSDIFGSSDTSEGIKPDSSSSYGSSASSVSSDAKAKVKADHKSMALVDVVIIRSEERVATSKGVNLLSGLTSTLSGTLFSMNDSRTVNHYGANSGTTVFTVNPSFSLSASYSLNIFNDNFDKNEVLARPTLVALNNKKSEFFSGAVLHVELTGSSGSQGAVQSVPVGVKLDVTPKFWGADEVELKVTAARAFIEGRSSNAGFNNFTQTTKNTVTANVTMKFGDTLVLSGLSEKETENLRDGVPLLQDIPVVQYLFSSENTLDYTKSVLILVTPRKPNYTYEDGSDKVDMSNPADAQMDQKHLADLKASKAWHKPASNLDAVFWHLRNGKFFTEFRSGDVRMEKWNFPGRLERMTERVLQFLYF